MAQRLLNLNCRPEIANIKISSLMFYPEDENKRAIFFLQYLSCFLYSRYHEFNPEDRSELKAKLFSRELGQFFGDEVYKLGGWEHVSNAMFSGEQINEVRRNAQKKIENGKITGLIFWKMWRDRCSKLESAKWIVDREKSELAQEIKRLGIGIGQNEMTHVHNFRSFCNVSHLWCAYVLSRIRHKNSSEGIVIPNREYWWLQFDIIGENGIKEFLEMAESLRQWGVSAFPRQGPQNPYLPPDKAWGVTWESE